jgi:hypothetical protein
LSYQNNQKNHLHYGTYNKLLGIAYTYPKLTYNNKGYDSLNLDTLTEEERTKFNEVQEVLRNSIKGFSKFNHFRITPKTQKWIIRFQYDWSADIPNQNPFTGVGYLELEELYKGFKENQV